MEELLKQILENQLTMNNQFVKIQENQIEMMKQMNERFEKVENRIDNLEKEMKKVN